MIPQENKPLAALCILCHDADTALPFYRDVLGLHPDRAEESFYSLAGPAEYATLCLWEIGHIAHNSVFTDHPPQSVPQKYMVTAGLPTQADVDTLRAKVTEAGCQLLDDTRAGADAAALIFLDVSGVIWHIEVNAGAHTDDSRIVLDSITLLCQDMAASRVFYEEKIGFRVAGETAAQVIYSNGGSTHLVLWEAADAQKVFGLPDQAALWQAHTGMIALAYDRIDQMTAQYQTLRNRGVIFREEPAHFQWDFDAAYFCDPDSNIWEIFSIPQNIHERMLPVTEVE